MREPVRRRDATQPDPGAAIGPSGCSGRLPVPRLAALDSCQWPEPWEIRPSEHMFPYRSSPVCPVPVTAHRPALRFRWTRRPVESQARAAGAWSAPASAGSTSQEGGTAMFRGQAPGLEDRKPRVQLAHRRVLTTSRFPGGEPQEDRKTHEKPGLDSAVQWAVRNRDDVLERVRACRRACRRIRRS